jgi:hypothetical protein
MGYDVVITMEFEDEEEWTDLDKTKELLKDTGSVKYTWEDAVVTAKVHWGDTGSKYGAARPIFESMRMAIQPLEDYNREYWADWPIAIKAETIWTP